MKIRTKITKQTQNELTKTAQITYLIMTIIGAIGLFAYIVLGTITNANVEFMLAFSVPFAFGLVFYITIKKQIKNIPSSINVNVYDIFEDHLTIKSITNGEEVGNNKVYYKDIIKRKETKNYIFLYPNKVNAFPIAKEELSDAELTELRAILKMPQKKQK